MRSALPPFLLALSAAIAGACDDGSAAPGDGGAPDASPGADAAPDADTPPVSCNDLPAQPNTRLLPGFVGTEDITFDDAGHVIESDSVNIYKTTRAGERKVFVANLPFRAGMRMTRSGKLIVNDNETGTIWRIEPNGERRTLMTGVVYPNGMEVGKDGFVYFTDQEQQKVYRLDVESGAHTVLTTGVPSPNGLTFDPTYRKLYVGSFCGDKDQAVYVLDLGADGTPGELRKFKTGVGSGCHDGMAVDACGNVYVADFTEGNVYRISADGQTVQKIVSSSKSYHANFDWGRGVGGWASNKLYIIAVGEGIKEVDVGVPGKAR